jgi:hypothetical protein
MPVLRPRVSGGDVRTRDGRLLVNSAQTRDGFVSAITKWVPIEVITFYEAVTSPFGNNVAPFLLFAICAGVIVTFLWTAFATTSANAVSRVAWRQVILATIAFVFWAVGTTSPDVWKLLAQWWQPGINPATLAAAAIVLPIADGILKRLGVPQD